MTTTTQFDNSTRRGGIDATWRFPDGVVIHAMERTKHQYNTWREVEAKVRVYVDANQPFNVLEDLTNRTRRPHHVWRPRVVEALARIGVEFAVLGWSQKAGCSMCPCSPGFVCHGENTGAVAYGWDFWVTLPDAPTVDERKPARLIA